jgi:hypothetical protein
MAVAQMAITGSGQLWMRRWSLEDVPIRAQDLNLDDILTHAFGWRLATWDFSMTRRLKPDDSLSV